MDDIFLDVDRVEVGGGPRCFHAAALVDRDIHHHAPSPHLTQHLARDELGRFRSRDEHRADEQVDRRH